MGDKLARKVPTPDELGLLNPGDKIFCTWGPEKYSPIQYHTFDVGPFAVETTVRAGETGQAAFERGMKVCLIAARASYPQKRDEYLENVKEAADKVRESRR